VKFTIDGKSYEFDTDTLTFDEAELLEDHAGLTLADFDKALQQSRIRAVRAAVLIAKRRAGEQVEWADLGSLDLIKLSLSLIEENDLDLTQAANGQNPEAVTALAARLAKPKTRKRA